MNKWLKKILCSILSVMLFSTGVEIFAEENISEITDFEHVYSFDDISEQGKRITTISSYYDTGEKCFSIAGLWSSSATKYFVLDITDPLNIIKTQELQGTFSQIVLSSNRVYALNTSSNTVDIYLMDDNGYVDLSQKISSASVGRAADVSTIKVMDDRYIFVSTRSAKEAIMIFDAQEDMRKVISLASEKPTETSGTGIQISFFDVLKNGDGLYRIYSYNRCFYNEKHNYELAITDVDLNDEVSEILYWGNVDESSTVSSGTLNGINVLNKNTIVLTYPNKSCGAEIIDVTDPKTPEKKAIISDIGRGRTFKKLDNTTFIIGSEDNPVCAYQYEDGSVSKVNNTVNTSGQVYGIETYNGYMILANNSVINIYSYQGILNVESNQSLPSYEPCIVGEIFGYIPQKDSVKILVNGKEYSANIIGNRFSAELEDYIYDTPMDAEIMLYRNDVLIDTQECVVNVTKKERITFKNISSNIKDNKFEFNADIENESKGSIKDCVVYAAVYSGDKMSSFDYQTIGTLECAESTNVTLSSEFNNSSDQYIKVFVVLPSENNMLLSDVLLYPQGINENDYSNLIDGNLQTDKAVVLEYDFDYENEKVKFNATASRKNTKAVMTVYKNTDIQIDNLDYINVLETDNQGRLALNYEFNNKPQDYDIFTAKITVEKDYDSKSITFVGKTIIEKLYSDIENSTSDTIYSILTSDEYKTILNLNFDGEYTALSDEGKEKVLSGISGRRFNSIKEIENEFNYLTVSTYAVELINNEEDADKLVSLIEKYMNDGIVQPGEIYEKALSATLKKELIENELLNKTFSEIDQLNNTLQNGSKIIYLNNQTYQMAVDGKMIENYGKALGIRTEDITAYLNSKYKTNIIKAFLREEFKDVQSIVTRFSEAVTSANRDSNSNSNSGSGGKVSGGGGGGGTPVRPTYTIEPVSPSEIVENRDSESNGNSKFIDVKESDWFSEAIHYLAENKIAEGITNDTFEPEKNITREEFVKMIICAFGLEDNAARTSFKDTNMNSWHYLYIASAQKYHIVEGETDEFFGVGKSITREDMTTILDRVFNLKDIHMQERAEVEFSDQTQISLYAQEGVMRMYKFGVINGFEDGSFGPQKNATRAMAAQMIYNILKGETE